MTREEFIAKKAKAALWDVAVSINRTNPLPLDSNGVFFSMEDAEEYVSNSPVAYAGQLLAVVGEDKTEVFFTAYDENGDLELKSLGSAAGSVDEKSVEVVNDKIQIKNFGSRYYRYVDATEETEAHYELVENDFKSGLEPRVATVDGELVIEWYEPSSTTVEGLSARIANAEQNVSDLANRVSVNEENIAELQEQVAAIEEVDILELFGGTANGWDPAEEETEEESEN